MSDPTIPRLRCEILSTGDEVLTGQIADTNAAFLADQMGGLGFEVARHTTVGDDRAMLSAAFRELGASADVVLCTGGLGPTVDDLTTEVAAEVLGCELALDEAALAYMEGLWARRGRPMPENNRKQALLPAPAQVLANPIGTAPGFTVKIGRAAFFFMPGVPREMKKMFAEQVVPRVLAMRSEPTVFEVRVLRSFGLAESALDEALSDLEAKFAGVKLGFRAHFPEIQIKLTVKGPDATAAQARLDAATEEVMRRVGLRVFSSDGRPLEEVVGAELVKRGATLATAEGSAGGALAEMIARVAATSPAVDRSIVASSERAKTDLLGVSPELIAEHGSVSEACARAMAEGARARAEVTHGLAVSELGSDGTVFVAVADASGTVARSLRWPMQREQVRALSAMGALDLLRRSLGGLSLEDHDLFRARAR